MIFLIGMNASNELTGCIIAFFFFQYLEAHLKFLAFFLQEATLYLGWNRAKEIWECLVTGQDVCELDREVCKTVLHSALCLVFFPGFGSSVCIVSVNNNGRVGTISTRRNVLKKIYDLCKCVSSLIILIQFWVKY